MIRATQAVLHLRFSGRSLDIPLSDLDVTQSDNDRQVKQALACYLDVPAAKISGYVVDRHRNGNLTVRPQAVFG